MTPHDTFGVPLYGNFTDLDKMSAFSVDAIKRNLGLCASRRLPDLESTTLQAASDSRCDKLLFIQIKFGSNPFLAASDFARHVMLQLHVLHTC